MSKVWYTHQNLKPQGPFTLEEMRSKVHRGEIGPRDLICNTEYENGRWIMAQSWAVFEQTLYPAHQEYIPGMPVQKEVAEWVLLFQDPETGKSTQAGPFSVKEILRQVKSGERTLQSRVWKSGLSGWVLLQDRPEFSELTSLI